MNRNIYILCIDYKCIYACVCVYVCVFLNAQQQIKASQLSARRKRTNTERGTPIERERVREKENERSEEQSERAQAAAEPPQHLIKYCSMGTCCCDCCVCLRQVNKKVKVKEALECTNNSRTTVQSNGEKTETERQKCTRIVHCFQAS